MTAYQTAGALALRLAIAYVYLYALYMNVRDANSRKWLVDHTAYLFPNMPEPRRTQFARLGAVGAALTMAAGGLSVLIGVEGRIGALLLLLFTAAGIYQHKRERDVAMSLADRVAPSVPQASRSDFELLRWSAYSGHFSSGLKNYGLCGACAALIAVGTGPVGTISDIVGTWLGSP